MDATRESEELVRLWQELQEAQVAGDAGRLAALQARAAAEGQRVGASGEWALLQREAGRNAERLRDDVAARPNVEVAGSSEPVPVETVRVDTDSPPEPVPGGRKASKKGSLIWLAFVVGWVLLQVVQGLGGENGSP